MSDDAKVPCGRRCDTPGQPRIGWSDPPLHGKYCLPGELCSWCDELLALRRRVAEAEQTIADMHRMHDEAFKHLAEVFDKDRERYRQRVAELEAVLQRVRDPEFVGKSWKQVREQQRMNPDDPVSYETFAAMMFTQWIYSSLADAALSGTPLSDEVRGVVERHDAAIAAARPAGGEGEEAS